MTVKEICSIMTWDTVVYVKRRGPHTVVADAYCFYIGEDEIHRKVQNLEVTHLSATRTGSIELFSEQ